MTREDERRPPPPVEAEVAERRRAVEERPRRRASATCQPSSSSSASGASSGQLSVSETSAPEHEQAAKARRRAPARRRITAADRGRASSSADAAAKQPRDARGRPASPARSRRSSPAARPAWRARAAPRKPELADERERDQEQPGVAAPPGRDADRVAEPERDRRGRSTSQKWAGWLSQRMSTAAAEAGARAARAVSSGARHRT